MKGMNKVLSYLLMMLILASCVPLTVIPVAADEKQVIVPGDLDGDKIVSEDELVTCILSYLNSTYLGGLVEHLELDELRESAHIHMYYPRTITDSADRTVVIYMPIKRIIVLNSDAAEGVKVLGEVENIVGVVEGIQTKKSYYFPELLGTETVGTWKEFDYEKMGVIAANGKDYIAPDILVISYVSKVSGVEEGLAPFENITVVALDFYKQTTVADEVTKMGTILEREVAAQDYIDWCQEKEDAVTSSVGGLPEPTVFIEGKCKGLGDIATKGPGSASNDLCVMAGGINIAGNLSTAYPHVEWEWVLDQNLDVIIKEEYVQWGWDNIDEPEALINNITSRPGAENVTAVNNSNVYACSTEPLYGMDSVVGLTYWAKLLHPDADLDPKAVYTEYLTEFMGITYPEDLIFLYPPLES